MCSHNRRSPQARAKNPLESTVVVRQSSVVVLAKPVNAVWNFVQPKGELFIEGVFMQKHRVAEIGEPGGFARRCERRSHRCEQG